MPHPSRPMQRSPSNFTYYITPEPVFKSWLTDRMLPVLAASQIEMSVDFPGKESGSSASTKGSTGFALIREGAGCEGTSATGSAGCDSFGKGGYAGTSATGSTGFASFVEVDCCDSPHTTSTKAAIVVSRRCFIFSPPE